ncbi:hypothetical protein C8E03_101493 [Lachnotalea glycerini]|uniref:Adenylylsulfate kinase n=1 Tax=Lachnotalea glycerini TaxID=1763509 RepID=A0A318EUD8_9FIRM|nr:ATP-binding protein [Lachnotalea glycerini]PXV95862.1 hypothetical protein C8E03_101493 [Lachnotalea glycerini]
MTNIVESNILKDKKFNQILMDSWNPPVVSADISHGDMPGDKVEINETHIAKANIIFPELLKQINTIIQKNKYQKAVIAICGGSGVGKSEIASLISYYFQQIEVGSYTLSGDNYPHKIPKYNDAERLHVFRESAIKGMIKEGEYTKERFDIINKFQQAGDDANPEHIKTFPWFESYLNFGKKGLQGYLGTKNEIGFDDITSIISSFKKGEEKIWLKRMGREDTELWYEQVDFSKINVLVIEWTHGNSDNYQGVDIPILLNSTPQETLSHRRARNRDGATDSPFTTMVLELEQKLLEKQSHKAKIILSKNGELLTYNQYCKLMLESKQ